MRPYNAPALPTLAFDRFPAEARGAIETAWREAADAAANAKDGAAAAGRLAMVLQSWEQWTTALTAYQRAQALAPETFDWWYLAGIVETRIGRPADAARSFEHAIALTPTYVPARLKLAEALFDAGNLAGSARAYDTLAREATSAAAGAGKSPGAGATAGGTSEAGGAGAAAAAAPAPAVQYGLGRIKAAQGDSAAAVRYFEEACRLFPEFGAAHYALALAYRGLGRVEEAQREIALHQRYTNAWPGVDDPVAARIAPLRDDARAHMERGIAAWKAGKLDEAIKEHEEAVRLQPALAQAHANLIVLYGHKKNSASAEAHYRTVVTLNSNLGEAHYNYGVLLMDLRRQDDAIDTFKKALTVNPHNAPAHVNLGLLLEMRQAAGSTRRSRSSKRSNRPRMPTRRATATPSPSPICAPAIAIRGRRSRARRGRSPSATARHRSSRASIAISPASAIIDADADADADADGDADANGDADKRSPTSDPIAAAGGDHRVRARRHAAVAVAVAGPRDANADADAASTRGRCR